MVASSSIPTPAGEPPAPFRPDPDQAALLFDALASPTLSLQQVAVQFNTTVEALSIFITAPRGSEALASIDAALFTRLRLIALSALPSVVASLAAIVDEHSRFEAAEPEEALSRLAARSSSSAPNPNCNSSADPLARFKLLERKRINARKAGSLLYRLATLHPREPRRDHPSAPPRSSSTTMHTRRAAHTPNPPFASPPPVTTNANAPHDSTALSPSAPLNASDPLDALDPLDPVDRFNIPSFLRARVPVATQLIAHAVPASGGMFPAPGETCGLTIAPTLNPSVFSSASHDHPRPRIHIADGSLPTTIASEPTMFVAPQAPDFGSPHVERVNHTLSPTARTLIARAGSTTPIAIASDPALSATSALVAASHSPTGCSPVAACDTAPRNAHPGIATPNHRTLNGSALRAQTPASLASGP